MDGFVDPAFESARAALLEGFADADELGAAVAAYVGGRKVVDLWHGHRDRQRRQPWQENTLVCVFSVTKALTTLCVLQAVDRGLLALDVAVADYWPEFAAGDKSGVTVRHLLTHQAGVVGFHAPADRDILYDWDRCTAALAAEPPWWEPGSAHGYHARSFGYLLGETLRRATGRSVGRWLRDEIAGPLQADCAIGLEDADLARCAELAPARMRAGQTDPYPAETRAMMARIGDPATPTGAAFGNPALGPGYANSAAYRRAEMPAANGHATARAVARILDAVGALVSAELLAEATDVQVHGDDRVLLTTTRFGLGFMLNHPDSPLAAGPASFGHAGAGGSIAVHDPELSLSVCYVMNRMQPGVIRGSPAAVRTIDAIVGCAAGQASAR